MLTRLRHLRQFLLIALMAFTLVGVQLVQSSPLHNHAQHTVDCALCHLQLGDDTLVRHSFAAPSRIDSGPPALAPATFYVSSYPAPYQGRAPPFALC